MKTKFVYVLALLGAIAGCAEDSQRPVPTGKGTVQAINAVKSSPAITFLIEETAQALSLSYMGSSVINDWDDFDYNFNFDTLILGDTERTRVATQPVKVEANQRHTLVLTGTLDNAAVTVWQVPEREFDENATVFAPRFAHLADSQGSLDFYFAPASTPPALGQQRGTLSFGQVLDPVDVEGGNYVITVTTAGDPSDVVYQSNEELYGARTSSILALFDTDEQSTAPHIVQIIGSGGTNPVEDARFSPRARLVQASITLPPSDVYDDELLTNLVVADHQFGDATAEFDVAVGLTQYTYTAVGNPSAVQFTNPLDTFAGGRFNYIVVGDADTRTAIDYAPDRRSNTTLARFTIFHAALNHFQVDVYLADRGQPLDEDNQRLEGLGFSFVSANIIEVAGSFDIWVTAFDDPTTILTGPFPLDLALGDVPELILVDNVDPAIAELRVIPPP